MFPLRKLSANLLFHRFKGQRSVPREFGRVRLVDKQTIDTRNLEETFSEFLNSGQE